MRNALCLYCKLACQPPCKDFTRVLFPGNKRVGITSIFFWFCKSSSKVQPTPTHCCMVSSSYHPCFKNEQQLHVPDAVCCAGKNNVAFLSYFITGQTSKCLELLINTNRLPEAAFFARTYAPSQVNRYLAVVDLFVSFFQVMRCLTDRFTGYSDYCSPRAFHESSASIFAVRLWKGCLF